MAKAKARAGRAWRWLRLLLALLLGLTLAGALTLRTDWAREALRVFANDALAELFLGRIEVERLGYVGAWRVSGIDARITDPEGRQVARVRGLRANASLPRLALALLTSRSTLDIRILSVTCDHIDVTLRDGADGRVSLASTFELRGTPAQTTTPSLALELNIGDIALKSGWLHGTLGSSLVIDAELRDALAQLRYSAGSFELQLAQARLNSRSLPYALDPQGVLQGRVEVPSEPWQPLRIEAELLGSLAESPALFEASLVGEDLYAWLWVAPIAGETLAHRFSGLAFQDDLKLQAEAAGTLPELAVHLSLASGDTEARAEGYLVVAGQFEATASVSVSQLNLARFAEGAPQTELNLQATAMLFEQQDGELVTSQRVQLAPGWVAGQASPQVLLRGRWLFSHQGQTASGVVTAQERGMRLDVGYALRAQASGAPHWSLTAAGEFKNPERLRKLGIESQGHVRAQAEWSPSDNVLAARVTAMLGQLQHGQLQTDGLRLQARVHGTLAKPTVEAAFSLQAFRGRAHGDLKWTPQTANAQLIAADLDLLALGRSLGVDLPIDCGRLDLDGTLRQTRGELSGSLAAITRGLRLRGAGDADFNARFSLLRRKLSGSARAALGQLGSLELTASEIELPRGVLTPSVLATAKGALSARGDLDLARLLPLLKRARLPLERASGKVSFDVLALHARDSNEGLSVAASLETRELLLVEQRAPTPTFGNTAAAVSNAPLALEGVDFRASVQVLAARKTASGTLNVRDSSGTLAEAQAEAQLAGVWAAGGAIIPALLEMPLRAKLHVPNRPLPTLPARFRPSGVRGRVSLDAHLEGSLGQPRMQVQVLAQSIETLGSQRPVDLKLDALYTTSGGEAQLAANCAGALVADLSLRWRGELRRALATSDRLSPIAVDADARLDQFPLDVVPLLADRQMRGRLSGVLTLRDWGKDASFDARLVSTSLSVDKLKVTGFLAEASAQRGQLASRVELRIGRGLAQASLSSAVDWGRRWVPTFERRARVTLETSAFQIQALRPLLGTWVSELSGVLNARTQLEIAPDATRLSGSAALEHGVLQLPQLGQRFNDISARLMVSQNRVYLEQFSARGLAGRVTATGSARLEAFELRSAEAKLSIARHEKLPITLEGATIGDAWGNVKVTFANSTDGRREFHLDLQKLNLAIPETEAYGLQSMAAADEIRIGVRRADGQFVQLPVQPLEPGGKDDPTLDAGPPLQIEVRLGDVTIERGRTASVQLTGKLSVVAAKVPQVTGRIVLRGGRLDVSGKTFEVERGVIAFDGRAPGNPTITATARWDSPSDHTVYAEYVGDVENGRLKLRSEPPLSQDAIANLLLFGSIDGPGGDDAPDSAAVAVSVAGETAVKGLNQVLSDFTSLDLSTRVDTSTGSARPELVFQVSRRLAAKVSRAIGEPAGGDPPDRTFLTLELRLKRSWALAAVLGDHGGSALDLIWRRHY